MCEACRHNAAHGFAPTRRRLLMTASAIGLSLASTARARQTKKETNEPPKPQNVVSPDAALKRLMAGNERYVVGDSLRHDFRHGREALLGGRNPFAAILSCADARVAPEYAFDSGRGDLFVCRVAGNFAADEAIASLEYAVAVLNVPLIFVLGHDGCGAVEATINSLKDDKPLPGHLPALVGGLSVAVKAAAQQTGDPLDNAIRQNVIETVIKLKSAAPVLNAAVDQTKLKVAGGVYRRREGTVDMVT